MRTKRLIRSGSCRYVVCGNLRFYHSILMLIKHLIEYRCGSTKKEEPDTERRRVVCVLLSHKFEKKALAS